MTYRDNARPKTVPIPDTVSSMNLNRNRSLHLIGALNAFGLFARLATPISRVVGFDEQVQLVADHWVICFVNRLEGMIFADPRVMMRSPDFHARCLRKLLEEHGPDAFDAAYSLGGPDAVTKLLRKSLMIRLMDQVDGDLARAMLSLSHARTAKDP